MHELPRKSSLRTPTECADSMTLFWIYKFCSRKSTGKSLLALIPPTLAAARMICVGCASLKNARTAAASVRSTSSRVRTRSSNFSPAVFLRSSARTMARPTNPRWPATKMRWSVESAISALLPNIFSAQFVRQQRNVRFRHDAHELRKFRLRCPAKFLLRFCRVADQQIDLGRPVIMRIDLYIFFPFQSGVAKREIEKLADGMRFAGCDDVVVRFFLLQHEPHGFDIFRRVTPVAFCVEVPQIQLLLQTGFNASGSARDLARNERFAAARRFVIEQNPVAGVNAVRLAVVHRHPVGVNLGRAVRTSRIKGSGFALRRFPHQAKHFTAARLVKTRFRRRVSHRFEDARGSDPSHVAGVFRNVEAYANVALRAEIVYLVRFDFCDQREDGDGIRQVAMVQKKTSISAVRIFIDRFETFGVERRGAPDEAMNFVSFAEQKLGQIRTVLAGDASDQRFFHVDWCSPLAFEPGKVAAQGRRLE